MLFDDINNMNNKYLKDMFNCAHDMLSHIPHSTPECTLYAQGYLSGGIAYAFRSCSITLEEWKYYNKKADELLEWWRNGEKV